jgi:amidohydrolase
VSPSPPGRLVDVTDAAAAWLARHERELVGWRHHLHANPELGREEIATTAYVAEHLAGVGLEPTLLEGTGLICDLGDGEGPMVLLRADLDALPIADAKDVSYRSTANGVTHACGHDAHTAIVLGAGHALHQLQRERGLPGRVRLLFQPAEELMPGGALDCLRQGVLRDVSTALALHCDPSLDAGLVGVRTGAITSAADRVDVRLTGPGGHTSRPHQTVDLVAALGAIITQVPLLLSRRLDPRTGASLVWGAAQAGQAANAIPSHAVLRGTVRALDADAWSALPELVEGLVRAVVEPYGPELAISYVRGVPPVVNAARPTQLLEHAADAALGVGASVPTQQSLGGEDFAWYLQQVPGAMARLGVRKPGWSGPAVDLHQDTFDLDESALATGVRVLVGATLSALAGP